MPDDTGKTAKIRLLLADVDGTLVDHNKVLTERAQSAVHQLKQAGIHFAITSGRPPKGMAMLIEPLTVETPIAAFNGGVFVDSKLEIIEQHTLDAISAAETIQLIDAAGLDVWVYSDNDWLVRDEKAPHVEREAWTVKFLPRMVKNFDESLQQAIKIVGVSDDHDLVQKAESQIQQKLGQKVSAARSQPYYLDVTHPRANKGAVFEYLAKRYDIPANAIATIGDMPNDILMFEPSGLSIAMGNASDAVKQKASVVTDSCDDEGFAKAVEKYILREGI